MGQNIWAWSCALVVSWGIAAGLHAQRPDGAGDQTADSSAIHGAPAAAAKRIEQALDQQLRSPLQFVETPLNQITQIIAEEYDLPIVFDTAALDAVATSPEDVASIDLGNVTLRSALDLMLKNVGTEELTYIIDNEVLLITTQEEAEQQLAVHVYRVDVLLGPAASQVEMDRLIDVIVASVERESWQQNGTGQGEIHGLPPAMLVVATTRRVHQQIASLLDDLQRTKAAIEADHAPDRATAEVRPVTRAIRLRGVPADTPETRKVIAQTLRDSIEWQVEDGELAEGEAFLHVLPDRIVVRHRPAVIRQVESVIQELAAPNPAPAARGGFGGGGRGGGLF